MSKTGKVISSIALIVTIIILIILMLWGMGSFQVGIGRWMGNSSWTAFGGRNTITLGNSHLPANAEQGLLYEVPADSIAEISLNFAHENIEVVAWEQPTLRIEQVSSKTLSGNNIMRYGMKDGKVIAQSGWIGKAMRGIPQGSTIKVSIPSSVAVDTVLDTASGTVQVQGGEYRTLHADTASGNIAATDISAHEFDANTASGRITAQNANCTSINLDSVSGAVLAENCTSAELDSDTTSGAIDISGNIEHVQADTMSGNVTASLVAPKGLKTNTVSGRVMFQIANAEELKNVGADTISGEVEIQMPDNNGFTVDFDSISGDLINRDFEMLGDRHNDGRMSINVDTVSGNLKLVRN